MRAANRGPGGVGGLCDGVAPPGRGLGGQRILFAFGGPAAGGPAEVNETATAGDVAGGQQPGRRARPCAGAGVALLLGQYLSAGGVLSVAEEAGLHAEMLRGAVAAGHRRLEFKPHPSAPVGSAAGLRAVAAELGVELAVRGGDELAEARFARGGVALVVGCFSTALATARFYGLPTATVGTDLLLERLTPYENSNRVPVTIVRATVRDLDVLAGCADHRPPPASELDLSDLVGCVAYCMQPRRNPDLRSHRGPGAPRAPGRTAPVRQAPPADQPRAARRRSEGPRADAEPAAQPAASTSASSQTVTATAPGSGWPRTRSPR